MSGGWWGRVQGRYVRSMVDCSNRDVERLLTFLELAISVGSATDMQIAVKWEIVRRGLHVIEAGECDVDGRVDERVSRFLASPAR